MLVWLCQIAKHAYFAQLRKEKRRSDQPVEEVFMLRVFGELSFQKIAQIFDKTESWARITFHRGKLKLINKMEKNNGGI